MTAGFHKWVITMLTGATSVTFPFQGFLPLLQTLKEPVLKHLEIFHPAGFAALHTQLQCLNLKRKGSFLGPKWCWGKGTLLGLLMLQNFRNSSLFFLAQVLFPPLARSQS